MKKSKLTLKKKIVVISLLVFVANTEEAMAQAIYPDPKYLDEPTPWKLIILVVGAAIAAVAASAPIFFLIGLLTRRWGRALKAASFVGGCFAILYIISHA